MTEPTDTPRNVGIRLVAKLIANRPVSYAIGLALWMTVHVAFIALGLIGEAFVNSLEGVPGAPGIGMIIGILAAFSTAQLVVIGLGMWQFSSVVFRAGATLAQNMFHSLIRRPGATPAPLQTGEVVSRFRDDVEHVQTTFDHTVDLAGSFLTGVVSFVIMARISPLLAVAAFFPVLFVIFTVRVLGKRIAETRDKSRSATETVTGLLGETFASVQAIKVAGAESSMVTALEPLNEHRRKMMVRDRVMTETVAAVSQNTTNIGTGLVLLIAVATIGVATPEGLTIGQFTLFTYLLGNLSGAAYIFGDALAMLRQADVSGERMRALVTPQTYSQLTEPRTWGGTQSNSDVPAALPEPKIDDTTLLSVRSLGHRFAGTDAGIDDVTFQINPGQFVVVTGKIGSGKTTLLRTVLGLLPPTSGEVLWHGNVVDDLGTTMVPPRVAYTPQVPKLFSMSLLENLTMGLDVDDDRINTAVADAALDHDIASMSEGIKTMVGTRGTRLSGGQAQRASAARMLIRQPELLVIDDVSSALDVDTEAELWQRLFDSDRADGGVTTALVVSHRRPALTRADNILVLDEGKIVATGTAKELRTSSSLFTQLWGK